MNHIVSNYGPGVYFFAETSYPATKQDQCLLVEASSVMPAVNSDGSWRHVRSRYCIYCEINSMIHGQHIYKSVWLPVIREQLYLEKDPINPHNDFASE